MIAPVRTAILQAKDAPAPSLVIDGSLIGRFASRAECRALVRTARDAALARHPDVPGLGVKTIVVLPPRDGVVRVEFFQGLAHGALMRASQRICVNSLACALAAAAEWHPELAAGEPVTALMSDQSYVLRPAG